MNEKVRSRRDKTNEFIRKTENFSKVLQMSKAMQTRFAFLPAKNLNSVVRAGIKDMSLGKFKNGNRVGRTVIRANHPAKGGLSNYDRITVDPKGFPNKNNLHLPVSASTVKALEYTQKGLIYTGKALLVLSILTTGARIAKSVYDEVTIDDEIESLGIVINDLEVDLEDEELENRKETEEALEYAKELYATALDHKANGGKKTVLTVFCVAGEFVGAAIGGASLSTAGATIGTIGGPVGALVGAVAGAVVGAIVGNETGASAINNFKHGDDTVGTAMDGNLLNIDNQNGEVLGVHGNASIGKDGVDIGATGAVLDWADKNSSISVLKTGGNLEFDKNGVDIGIEKKIVRIEHGNDSIGVGVGLSFDTGVKFKQDGAHVQFLGFGFSATEKGLTLKCPIFDFTFKSQNEQSKSSM